MTARTIGLPTADHQRVSYTPEKCQNGQSGPVWFLADQRGGREERTCTIPAGKSILVPLLTGECSYDDPGIKTDEGLRRCASAADKYDVIEATIDGVKLKSIEQYKTEAGFFNVIIPKANIYNMLPGTFKAYAEGFFIFLEPLKPGKHDIRIRVSVLNPFEPTYNYDEDMMIRTDLTYHLIVKP
jgi:hypothetical protein